MIVLIVDVVYLSSINITIISLKEINRDKNRVKTRKALALLERVA